MNGGASYPFMYETRRHARWARRCLMRSCGHWKGKATARLTTCSPLRCRSSSLA